VQTDVALNSDLGGESESWCGDYGYPVIDSASGHLRYCDVDGCPAGSQCYRQPTESLPARCCRQSMCYLRPSRLTTASFVRSLDTDHINGPDIALCRVSVSLSVSENNFRTK